MGQIIRTRNPAYVSAVEATLKEADIPVLVQRLRSVFLITVPDAVQDLALRTLRDAGLRAARAQDDPI